ncbi:MAG: 50S ribosome-binding GTPase [Planctomycetes bacterium]|nr:50S ribosome-binding GTPase [Planctomycetota bacterium]
MKTTVTLSLISHTNHGKTTLARTLLRRDVGEVADRPHVTLVAEAHLLVETPTACLRLWDTPGFGGDLEGLRDRLRREGSLRGWLQETYDRIAHRAIWCSQQAVRNVREEADLVLYLIDTAAAPDPGLAAYVAIEAEILAWIGRPVLVLLNRTGGLDPAGLTALEGRWAEHLVPWPMLRAVHSLDAFARCWVQEDRLLEKVASLLEGPKAIAARELGQAWRARQEEVFRQSCAALSRFLARLACDRAPGPPRKALGQLEGRRGQATLGLVEELARLHGLDRAEVPRLEKALRTDLATRGRSWIDEVDRRSGGFWGAVLGGLATGLAADIASGGLILGGGMILGAIAGALGGSALGEGVRRARGPRAAYAHWPAAFLDARLREALLRYLAVAHWGRGHGGVWRDGDTPTAWTEGIEAVCSECARADDLWGLGTREGPAGEGALARRLEPLVAGCAREILRRCYPDAMGCRGAGAPGGAPQAPTPP